MQKKYEIEIRNKHDYRDEIIRISNRLHDKAAHYIVVGSRQHQSIHKFRVCLKKLRGIIRLLRHEINPESYAKLNAAYRDIAKQVGSLRDCTSQITLIKKMLNQLKYSLLQPLLKESIRDLLKKRESEYKQFLEQNENTHIHQKIVRLKEAFQDLQFNGDPNSFILQSLGAIYKKAKRVRQNKELWTNAEIFHEWRKQVKYLMYHLMMLNQIWPKHFRFYIDELNSLQKILGTLHDMNHLKEMLVKGTEEQINKHQKNNIIRFMNRKERRLMQKADGLGKQLFVDSTGSFVKRIYKLWIMEHSPQNCPKDQALP